MKNFEFRISSEEFERDLAGVPPFFIRTSNFFIPPRFEETNEEFRISNFE
jgi:hypothetical protein